MKPLFTDNQLGIPLETASQRITVKCIKALLGLNKLSAFYNSLGEVHGVEFATKALDTLEVSRIYNPLDMQKIPTVGAAIIIANHPYGAMDGLLMMDSIIKYRPDAKIMGNFLMSQIEPISNYFISVDPFEAAAKTNIGGIRRAVQHLRDGKALILFPAGEVATYQKGVTNLSDKKWPNSIVRFIRSASVPVVPIHISGSNSIIFHTIGKIHPRLRTLRLIREFLNKRGHQVEINIGNPLSPKLLHSIDGDDAAALIMRANIEILRHIDRQEIVKDEPIDIQYITHIDDNAVAAEIENLDQNNLLCHLANLQLYFCSPESIPLTLKKIGELREQTFRAIGSGTFNAVDSDAYDTYYRHLFIYDTDNRQVVGAYRVGFGQELFENMGIDAFYTHTLFDFSHKFFPILRQTIELGRLFIIPTYQRKAHPLLLLWRGLLMILMQSEGYRYLMGTVSIPSSYTSVARRLMVSYIKAHGWSGEFSKFVVARHGIGNLSKPLFDLSTIHAIKSTDVIDKFIHDIDGNDISMPTLLKRYSQIGGKVLSFTVDHKFQDSLDALMLLDITTISQSTLELLNHEYGSNVPRRTTLN